MSLPPEPPSAAPRSPLSNPLRAKEPPNAALSRALCVPQAVRDQVRRVPAGHPAHAGGAPRPGFRVPPALLRLRRVQAAAGHGRRVLPHGRQPARVQGGLRDGQAARSVGGSTHPPVPVCKKRLAPVGSGRGGIPTSSARRSALARGRELKRLPCRPGVGTGAGAGWGQFTGRPGSQRPPHSRAQGGWSGLGGLSPLV